METTLIRDCSATVIPAGDAVTLKQGTPVFITQTLGGNVTVRAKGGLFRIASVDVDALEEFESGESESGEGAPTGDGSLEDQVWEALRQCFDPEIPINIVDLGLIYDMDVTEDGGGSKVAVKMTLTAQGCGMGPVIAEDARSRIESLEGVSEATVEIVWDPVWNPQMISEEGRRILGIE